MSKPSDLYSAFGHKEQRSKQPITPSIIVKRFTQFKHSLIIIGRRGYHLFSFYHHRAMIYHL